MIFFNILCLFGFLRSVGKVIGPKGKTVQMLIDTYNVTNINIEDDGTIQVE